MRSLVWADLQSHNYKEFSTTEDEMNSRLRDCIDTIGRISDSADQYKVDFIWFVGDLYQLKNNHDSQVIQATTYALAKLAEKHSLLLVPGHHDYRMWTKDPIMMEILAEFSEGIRLCSKPGWISPPSAAIQIYAEPCTRKVKELNARLQKVELRKNAIFLAHQDIKGVKYRGYTVERGLDADMLSEKFKWSFIGHWHKPKKIKKNVISIGAPLQHSFNDVGGKRGWWIFNDDDGVGKVTFIENTQSPQFWDIEIGDDGNVANVPKNAVDFDNDFFRVKIFGDTPPKGLEQLRHKRVIYEVAQVSKVRGNLKFSDSNEALVDKYVKLRWQSNKKGAELALEQKKLIEMGTGYL